ncbi:MAG: hypothetical protein HOV79_00430 [Hamadaea sp.]|nr:hypothetical protein [Hamadaea sp.]
MGQTLYVEMIFNLDPPITDTEKFHSLGDQLMEELLKLEDCNDDVRDAAVSTSADSGQLEVELVIKDVPHAMAGAQKALDVIRSAMHGVGFGTHGWPSAEDLFPVSMQASPVGALVAA